jgi:hypothetical protein
MPANDCAAKMNYEIETDLDFNFNSCRPSAEKVTRRRIVTFFQTQK